MLSSRPSTANAHPRLAYCQPPLARLPCARPRGSVLHLTGRQLRPDRARRARLADADFVESFVVRPRRRAAAPSRARPSRQPAPAGAPRSLPGAAAAVELQRATCSAIEQLAGGRASISSPGPARRPQRTSLGGENACDCGLSPGLGDELWSGRPTERPLARRSWPTARPATTCCTRLAVRASSPGRRRSGSVVPRRAGRGGGRLWHRALRPPRSAQPVAARRGHRRRRARLGLHADAPGRPRRARSPDRPARDREPLRRRRVRLLGARAAADRRHSATVLARRATWPPPSGGPSPYHELVVALPDASTSPSGATVRAMAVQFSLAVLARSSA